MTRALSAEGGATPDDADRLSPGELLAERSSRSVPELPPPNTSLLQKSAFESDDFAEDLGGREVRVHRVQRGDTLPRILARMGAEPWQARAMTDAARNALPEAALLAGFEVPDADMDAFGTFLVGVGYPHVREDDNPVYRFFLR